MYMIVDWHTVGKTLLRNQETTFSHILLKSLTDAFVFGKTLILFSTANVLKNEILFVNLRRIQVLIFNVTQLFLY